MTTETQEKPATPKPFPAPSSVTLTVEPVEGGAVLRVEGRGPNGTTSGNGIVGGDITTAMARRKIQKIFIRWVKQAFPAPKIVRKGGAAETEPTDAAAVG